MFYISIILYQFLFFTNNYKKIFKYFNNKSLNLINYNIINGDCLIEIKNISDKFSIYRN